MYFTSEMKDQLETADQSACERFAREFMPIVNEALAQVNLQSPTGGETTAATESDAAPVSTDAAEVEPAA
jgi:hypothetical protein